ncbi:fructosamine kinase family protein [Niabella terrae]
MPAKFKELQQILEDLHLETATVTPVSGGDSNAAYRIQRGEQRFFLKTQGAAACPGLFEQEAAGLELLRRNSEHYLPAVIGQGLRAGRQYLLLEWLEAAGSTAATQENFGRRLARQHRHSQPYFGLSVDNYIGPLHQSNQPVADWPGFYAHRRILPLVRQLADTGVLDRKDIRAANGFSDRIREFFPEEPSCLLHGDLWSGNYMTLENGTVAFFDPAVYYGHREMDIGMSLLFGGFSAAFYEGYREQWPLEPGWQQRVAYSQLYPLLVHALLFGGSYVQRVKLLLQPFFA